jgi:hypothetical protein
MNERHPWACPRCGRMNAPHTDYCDCTDDGASKQPVPAMPPQPPIVPWITTPPLPWWHPDYPFRITSSGGTTFDINTRIIPMTADNNRIVPMTTDHNHIIAMTVYATNEDNALLKFGRDTSTGVQ